MLELEPEADADGAASSRPGSGLLSGARDVSAAVAQGLGRGTSARPVPWSYWGDDGPAAWGRLSPLYAACAEGEQQSPIDIVESQAASVDRALRLSSSAASLKIAHHEHVEDIIDNGRTIQVTVDEGSLLHTERGTFELQQMHFHTPSEHTVGGRRFPMEAHFVHQGVDGRVAVVAVLFEEGDANAHLEPLMENLPAKGETLHVPDARIDLALHLPDHVDVYGYRGSFTTPPCTEDVEWLVVRRPVSASSEQLATLHRRLGHNARPLQRRRAADLHRGVLSGAWAD